MEEDSPDDEKDVDFEDSPVLAALQVPDPVFFCAIELHTNAQHKELDHALECLTREDPSFRVSMPEH